MIRSQPRQSQPGRRLPLSIETTNPSWSRQAESAIRGLRDIEGASVQSEGDEIREIHVLTTSRRAAKQIVRDVQTLLLTRFGRTIDHRIVSVAFAEPDRVATPERAPEPSPAAPAAQVPQVASDDRIRFVSANLYVSGPRVQAQVELKWRGVPRMGSASGWSTRSGAYHLIAGATLAAVQEYVEEEISFSLDAVEVVRIGRREVAVVSLELLSHRTQKSLVGCCTVGQDAQQAIVLATLAALNRVTGGLRTRGPSRQNSRPTSAWKESEAK